MECDLRSKKLLANTLEDEEIHLLLEKMSAHVMSLDNQLILNYQQESTMCAHLFQYKDY